MNFSFAESWNKHVVKGTVTLFRFGTVAWNSCVYETPDRASVRNGAPKEIIVRRPNMPH
jgi:hypothetical protein